MVIVPLPQASFTNTVCRPAATASRTVAATQASVQTPQTMSADRVRFDYDLKPHLPFLCEKNLAEPGYLATYSTDTQEWVKTSFKTASVAPPDCKLGKT